MSEAKLEIDVKVTPEMMAEAFWKMGSDEQARFFHALSKEIGGDQFHSECQWWYLDDELSKDGRDVLMSIAAPQYLNVLRVSGRPV